MMDSRANDAGLRFGAEVTVVKLRPDGSEAATYHGTLIESPPGWVVVRASWTFRRIDIGQLVFEPDDYLIEYFSTTLPFNAFAIFTPEETLKGWYCNVTHPTEVRGRTIYWHDLFIDVVQDSSGKIFVLDEDELSESGLCREMPQLHAMIQDARDSLVEKMRSGEYPFSEFAQIGP